MHENQEREQEDSKRKTLWRLSPTRICALFEEQLRQGSADKAEDLPYLKAVSPDDYTPLLFGLLQREMAWRREQKNVVTREELQQRLPAEPLLVNALFDDEVSLAEMARLLNGYEFLEKIKGGPIGGACKARHVATDRLRMVRCISPFFVNTEVLEHSGTAADVVHLFHPNITAPVELIEHDGTVLVVTEYFAGVTLAELVARHHPIPVPVVCEIVRQAASGLANMHYYFKAHEDIRPANIMIDTVGTRTGRVKVCGVAGGLLSERQVRFAMWPTSVLLHAPTYFAPEVMTGRRDPDMRSDIFGLGTVLHYALAGETDAWENHISNDGFESIVAHSQLRPDCPKEIEALILEMTAEDPEERIKSAAEIVERLSKHADAERLQVWISEINAEEGDGGSHQEPVPVPARAQPVDPRPERAQPVIVPQTIDRPKAAPARDTDVSQSPMPHKRLWKGIAAGLTGVVLLAMLSWFSRGLFIPSRKVPTSPEWLATLTELPGPNGDWWFDEMPWLTPDVRAEFARQVMADSPAIDVKEIRQIAEQLRIYPDYETVDSLKAVVRDLTGSMPDNDSLVVRQILEVDPQAHSVAELKAEYGDIVDELQPARLSSPTGWHLRANLLQASSNDKEAISAYERALALYRSASDEFPAGLQALCAADYARLLAAGPRDYKKANVYFRQCSDDARTISLKALSMCRMADAYRKWERYEDALTTLDEAEQLVRLQAELPEHHPLHAVVHETLAWTALDTWRLAEARKRFQAARDVREYHRNAKNPRNWRSILWIEQGQAMTAHFQGDQKEAEEKYTTLLAMADSSLKRGFLQALPKQQRTELAARRPNLYERLGDCYLFGAGIDHDKAWNTLLKAIEAAEDSSFDMGRNWPHILALKYKYAMALCLAGEREMSAGATASAEEELELRLSTTDVSDGQKGIYEEMRIVAQSVIHLDHGTDEQRAQAIRALEQYYSSATAHVTPKNINLVMFVSEELLSPSVLQPDGAKRIVRRLNKVIEDLQSADSQRLTSVYLQRYCESARRALQTVPVGIAGSETDKMAEQLAVVVSESQQHASPVTRGLTRGTIEYDEDGRPVSCRLHVLAIGVSEYQYHSDLSLTYADDDADALFETYGVMCRSGGSDESQALFERGQFRKLTNKEATRSAIIEAIEDVTSVATKNDLVIVSLSGHGTLDKTGKFYFLPYDYRDSALSASAIRDVVLHDLMTDNESNTILVMDACHSGAMTEISLASRSTPTQEWRNALHRFTTAKKGLCILAASLGSKEAFEDPELGHGVMTIAFLEALRGEYFPEAVAKLKRMNKESTRLPEPQGSSRLITLHDIQYYICSRVEQLSDGKQQVKDKLGGDLSMRDIPIRFVAAQTQD